MRSKPGTTRSRARHPENQDAKLVYLYAVVPAHSDAHRLLEARQLPGMDEAEPLFPIVVKRLVAAVSRVPGAIFQEEPLNALVADLERLAPFAVRHEEAIRALLPAAPALVPIAFGVVYRSPERVAAFLAEYSDEFHRLLGELADKEEWTLKVTLDLAGLRAATEQVSEALRQIQAEMAAAGPGKAYLLGKQRERLLTGEAERLADETLDSILARLAGASIAVRQDSTLVQQPGALQLVLKAAFLVERPNVEQFAVLVAEMERACQPLGFQLDLTGPWAPYSFVGKANGAA